LIAVEILNPPIDEASGERAYVIIRVGEGLKEKGWRLPLRRIQEDAKQVAASVESERNRRRRLTMAKSTRLALLERISTAAERTDEASSASASMADEMARSASSLAAARSAERRIRGLFPLKKGAIRSASAWLPVSPTPSMAALSCLGRPPISAWT
jgi:hypothetical protein